jgi:hypothetical protein
MHAKSGVLCLPPPSNVRGLFCTYRFPAKQGQTRGAARWCLRLADSGEILESGRLADIADAIRACQTTPRAQESSAQQLKTWREEIERNCVQRYLRDLQAPLGVKAELVCWMEIC